MAYKTKELREKALAAITENNLVFIEDVVNHLPCSKPTFYEHKLNEVDDIKEALENNRMQIKAGLRTKWYEGDNATTQIALYKLLSNEVEHKKLTGQTIMGDKDKPLDINVTVNID